MRCLFLALACLTPLPAQAVELHCLGLQPPFMLVLNEQSARFDYLGDGVFDLDPPLTAPVGSYTRLSLSSAGGPIPIYLERRPCPIFGINLPFTVELGIPAFAGQAPAQACCRDATPAS